MYCACCTGSRSGTGSQDYELYDNVFIESNLHSSDYDGVIFILYPDDKNVQPPSCLQNILREISALDKKVHKAATLWNCDYVAGERLIISPTGEITPYHDAIVIKEAAQNGMRRAIDAGIKRPIMILQNISFFPEGQLVTILGALEVLYVPLQIYERGIDRSISRLGLYTEDTLTACFEETVKNAIALEKGRILTRDIAGGDPERMSPANIVAYVKQAFAGDSNITVKIIEDDEIIAKDYPLLAAVSRAVNRVDNYKARIVEIQYTPPNVVKVAETIILVGKGVTYDTGGADIKIQGKMRGMSRDKSGAASVAGFLKACAILKPKHLKVIGVLCLCRNSVGSVSYVSDELLVSRSGKTVRVSNTDAEGRLAMADALTKAAEMAVDERNPHLYTIATLTGHCSLCYGDYTGAMDNHAARVVNHAARLQASAARISEGLEVSVVRPIDLKINDGQSRGDDLIQFDPHATGRNHQFAAGFLLRVSGLETKNIKYTHLDIAGSAGMPPDEPTAVPILTLCHAHKVINNHLS